MSLDNVNEKVAIVICFLCWSGFSAGGGMGSSSLSIFSVIEKFLSYACP